MCTRQELDFLLEGARSALKTDLQPEDVVGSIAGCRPLVARPAARRWR
jgi:glycerol-3-phosphate dehydrogenase